MRKNNALFLRCFEHEKLESGSARLRFRVNQEARAVATQAEAVAPDNAELSACLLRALDVVHFSPDAIGAEVVYPIHYDATAAKEPAATAPPPPRASAHLSIAPREGTVLIDDWWVVDQHGAGVSDLDLTRISGATQLHADLESKRTTLFTLSLIEGLAAAASFAAGGYGALRVIEDPQRSSRTADIALAASGGVVSLSAGALCLYHLIRAMDLAAAAPTWHHLDKDQAQQLVGRANAGGD
jgi:hypothetical protein